METNENKCCFIIPYFGKLPNYFQLFLNSCKCNYDYNWLLFTDDRTKYRYPQNVKVVYINFKTIKNMIQKKFDFTISLDYPYKLCDFKPAYGYIFEDYLINYKFWGHCDIDIIFGNINKFLPNNVFMKYDKIFTLGHLILYRNTIDNNRLFMTSYNGELLYKKVFKSNKILVFDETYGGENNINSIFLSEDKNVFQRDFSLNLNVSITKFTKVTYNYSTKDFVVEKTKNSIAFWRDGSLYRAIFIKKKMHIDEYLYIHLQSRKMKNKIKNEKCNVILIVPNKFIGANDKCNIEKEINKKRISFHYFDLRYKHYKRKILRMICKY